MRDDGFPLLVRDPSSNELAATIVQRWQSLDWLRAKNLFR